MILQTKYRCCLATALVLMLTRGALAINSPVIWDGDTDTDWNNGFNWVGDMSPPADDHAKVTESFVNQPTLFGAADVGGVWITNLGQDFGAVANDNILTIGGNTINGIPNLAVLFDTSNGFNAAIRNKISITGAGLVVRNDTDQSLSFSSLTNSVGDGVINLNSNTLTFSNHGAGLIDVGNIFGTGGVIVDSPGDGVFETGSNNTSFEGQLTVARGILQTNAVNSNGFRGKLGNSSLPVILGSNGNTGTLVYNGATNTVNAASTSGGTKRFTLATGGIGVFDISPASGTATLSLSGVIDGDGALQVMSGNGNGTLLLSGANTFTGGTRLVSGRLSLGVNTAGSITSGPVGTGTLTLAGGTLTSSGTRTLANPIVTDGSVVIGPGGTLTLTGSLSSTTDTDEIDTTTTSSAIAFNGDLSGYEGTIRFNRSGSPLNFNSQLVDLADARLVMDGSTASGGSQVRVGVSGDATPVTVKIGELSGSGGVINPQTAGTSQTYEIGSRDSEGVFGGVILGRIGRPVNVTKVGMGSLTLSGANIYFGGTNTVSSGALIAGADAISSTTMDGTNTTLSITDNVFTQVAHGLTDGDRIAFTTGSGALVTVTQWHVVNAMADTFQVSATAGGSPLTGITDAAAGVTTGIQAGAFGGGASAVVLGDANTGSNNVALLTGGPFTIERAVDVTANGSGMATIGGNTFDNSTFSGAISLARNVRLTSMASGGSAVNVTGEISSTGAFGVTKVDFGDAILSATNTYSGGTTVAEGKLAASGANATLGSENVLVTGGVLEISSGVLDAIANTATLSLAGGGTPDFADIGYAILGTGINEQVSALILAGLSNDPQPVGTYGSSSSGATFQFDEYFSGDGIITVGLATLPGDFNNDGEVDAADYVLWRKNPSNFLPQTYDTWRQNFGNPPGSGSGLGSEPGAVPEPGAIVVAIIGGLGLLASRRRARVAD